MTQQQTLITRLRDALPVRPSRREVAMFGGRSFMINNKSVVCAQKNGDLLVRVDARDHQELLARPGARQAEMGAGRTMGAGWISVESASITADADLDFWLATALEHNRTLISRA